MLHLGKSLLDPLEAFLALLEILRANLLDGLLDSFHLYRFAPQFKTLILLFIITSSRHRHRKHRQNLRILLSPRQRFPTVSSNLLGAASSATSMPKPASSLKKEGTPSLGVLPLTQPQRRGSVLPMLLHTSRWTLPPCIMLCLAAVRWKPTAR